MSNAVMDSIAGGNSMSVQKLTEVFYSKQSLCRTFKNYINDDEEYLKNIFEDENSYNIIAGMNSGKTKSLIKTAFSSEIKSIFLCPLQVNVLELAQEFPEGYYELSKKQYSEAVKYANERKNIGNSKVIVSVYDSFPKLIDKYKLDIKNYNLIIDEAHHLVNQYNFRSKALRYIAENKNSRKTVYLSGTPEGCIYFNHFNDIKFIKECPPERQKLNILQYEQDHEEIICEYIKARQISKDKKLAVFIENKNMIKDLETKIHEKFPGLKVLILAGDKKDTKEFKFIYEENKIPDDAACIITTSVISDGLNILNENIDSVILLNSENTITNRQYLARFRKGYQEAFLFLPSRVNQPFEKRWRLSDYFERIAEKYRVMAKLDQEIVDIETEINITPAMKNILPSDMTYRLNGKSYFSEIALAKYLLTEINGKIHKDIKSVEEYYTDIAGFDARIMQFDEFSREFLNGKQIPAKICRDIRKYNIEDMLNKHLEEFKSLALKRCPDIHISEEAKFFYSHKQMDSFRDIISKVSYMDDKVIRTIFKLRKKKNNKSSNYLVSLLKNYSLFKAVSDYPQIKNIKESWTKDYNIVDSLKKNLKMPPLECQTKHGHIDVKLLHKYLINKHKAYLSYADFMSMIESISVVKPAKEPNGPKCINIARFKGDGEITAKVNSHIQNYNKKIAFKEEDLKETCCRKLYNEIMDNGKLSARKKRIIKDLEQKLQIKGVTPSAQ